MAFLMIGHPMLMAQTPAATNAQPAQQSSVFKPEELEQIVAPIALYPDALLAQVFMASTYPLEIVQAARWAKEHPEIKGDAVAKAVETQPWDPAVKSLVAFPDVLAMMNEKLDWTQKLGDAFLAQQKDVMDAVQRLRLKAKESGNLKSSKEQTVKTEPAPSGAASPQIIVIESPSPEVVYVPTYNPTVVYGTWPYPAYPPYYYYPPAYVPGAAFFTFSAGVIVGGAIWGNCNWGGSDIDIDINRYNNFNRNEINHNNIGNRDGNRSTWQHNAEHRKGVEYRDSATQQKYGRSANQQGTRSREQFRGRADEGRQQISREGAASQRDLNGNQIGSRDAASTGQYRDLGSQQSRDRAAAQSRDLASQDRAGSAQRSERSSAATRPQTSDAFRDIGNGSGARASSSRGGASRAGASRGGRRR
ncbi:MAG TPA: DUF3300 domain-containing protein [Povalibacter sp.]|nr:DUF3300 domain-containing protein [Povalibacter sp.]